MYNSPYAFSENKVTAHIELEGLESWYAADGNVVGAGPLTNEEAKNRGAVEYGVLTDQTVTETQTTNTFTNEEVEAFVAWNQTADLKGACIGYATRGAEMLTGESAGWDTKSGNLNVTGKTVWDLGETMESKGAAVQISISPQDPAGAIMTNSSDVGPGENSAFIVGPGAAGHALITTYSGDTQQMSLIDQGSGWNRPSTDAAGYNGQIEKINNYTGHTQIKAWRLQKEETVTRRVEQRTPIQ